MTTVKITTRETRYRRTVNGAWVFGSSHETHQEVPEAEVGAWLASGSSRTATWPDGFALSVYDGSPRCGHGWGPLQDVTARPGHGVTGPDGVRVELVQTCDRVPGWGLYYHGVARIPAGATFREIKR